MLNSNRAVRLEIDLGAAASSSDNGYANPSYYFLLQESAERGEHQSHFDNFCDQYVSVNDFISSRINQIYKVTK